MGSASRHSEETVARVKKYYLKNPYASPKMCGQALGLSPNSVSNIRKMLENNNEIESRPITGIASDRRGR